MNFRPRRPVQPELNLIPLIDVLIVLLIFLVLTTTFSRESALRIRLPDSASRTAPADKGIEVVIDVEGHAAIDGTVIEPMTRDGLLAAMRGAIAARPEVSVLIRADRRTPHQSVMDVLDAASRAGVSRISFATQTQPGGPSD